MPERNAGLRAQDGITPYPASHIQQFRYVSRFMSRNITDCDKIRSQIPKFQLFLASHAVKKIASKEPSGKAGVQPVCGGQARRGEWPIMIHLEISQHAVVEVKYL